MESMRPYITVYCVGGGYVCLTQESLTFLRRLLVSFNLDKLEHAAR